MACFQTLDIFLYVIDLGGIDHNLESNHCIQCDCRRTYIIQYSLVRKNTMQIAFECCQLQINGVKIAGAVVRVKV